ncbi:hypothetical protein FK220_011530 [Flavobacteriaceae bacterium TP-CH-4]|uniref:Uncharacterized protein n=1 Tax=Pelagihabitans pacificus TaxID=2696054 RepID=A0A967AT98_9FLAO|nr:hypothetical protein [Pelagihabitans pacificus]NHF59976.1 hypothetical protein [Pelagihabitans pacificus]
MNKPKRKQVGPIGADTKKTTEASKVFDNPIDENTDDLQFKEISNAEMRTEWTFNNLEFAYSSIAEKIINNAKGFIDEFLKEIGPHQSKPVVQDVYKMFREAMNVKEAQNYIPIVEKIKQHTPGSFDDLLKAKYVFEQSSHKSQTAFMLTSIKGGAGIETAIVNWKFAEQSFYEAKENAESTFKEAVYAARADGKNKWEKKYSSIANEILAHVNHFSYASSVANATDAYGKLMAKAISDLTTANSSLITGLTTNWSLVAQGEATLIASNRKDSLALWTSIKNSYNSKVGGSRKF